MSSSRFNDDTSKIQFAIVSDLWGGNRPGIFEDAVAKLELLQPQFVISVGDLIDGKSYDPSVIKSEWDAFERAIKPLSMPFYYVPGNHDISNLVMEQEWKKRLGSSYYHFVYKNALFLCINTEDSGRGGIREGQIAYFKKAIEENPNVRWTFLFMHRPVWQGIGQKEEGYEKIESFLKGRNYTLFSGHHHTYLNVVKNGNKHFVLGTTGGGIELRGEKFGEFDHVTLVTLGSDEPKIVNLKLNGIIKEDVVNEKSHAITETLIDENWLWPIPYVSNNQLEKKIPVVIELRNPTVYPLKVSGNLCNGKPIVLSPCQIDLTISPNSKIDQQVEISKADQSDIDVESFSSVDISLNASYFYNNMKYELPGNKKLLLSYQLKPQLLGKPVVPTSPMFHGRDTSGTIALTNPEYLDRKWYWSGPNDGLLRFKMMQDQKFVYVLALINDDQWVESDSLQKDILYLHLEDADGNPNFFTYSPFDNKLTVDGKGQNRLKDVSIKKFFDNGTLMIEFKIPVGKVAQKDHRTRLNIGYRDQDNQPEKEYSILFWKPIWGLAGDYKDSGSYLLQ